MKNMKLLTLPKILMLIGAAWIIIFSILYTTKVITYNFFGWKESGSMLIIIGIMYILIPFSVKPGMWSSLWAIVITAMSVFFIISLFVGDNVDYKSYQIYVGALPHIVMGSGAVIWIFHNK